MRTRNEIASWSVVVIASLGLHAVAFGGIGGRADGFGRKKSRPPTLVEMSVAKPREEPPPPPPPAKVAQKSAPRLAMARPARTAAAKITAPPPPASAAPPPEAETPADFTGVTMTNDGPGAGWSSATGNGQTMNGPVGRPGARVTRRNVDGDGSSNHHAGPPVVGEGDLSRRPAAPDLTDVLARAYPSDARKKGISGKSVIRARIMPNGRVTEMVTLSESTSGFGAACQKTLRDSIWVPPLDRDARAVSTFINYTCRFEVQ